MKLGVIADDFTGATDIAGFLVEYGLPTILVNGVPAPSFRAEAEAYVISLKTRSCPVDQALDQSRRGMAWLQQMHSYRRRAAGLRWFVPAYRSTAVRQQLQQQSREGYRYSVLDTRHERHLLTLAEAVEDMPLLTGGSGLAMGLAQRQHKGTAAASAATRIGRPGAGKTVVLAGSCSEATNRQVGVYREKAPSQRLDPARCLLEAGYGEELFQWAKGELEAGQAPMLYASAAGEELRANRAKFGGPKLGAAIEMLFGRLAVLLLQSGVRNFIVAGGETSGQVVQSLGLRAFRIGPQVSPGVPWVKAVDGPQALLLKSGNFGDDDFFARSQEFFAD